MTRRLLTADEIRALRDDSKSPKDHPLLAAICAWQFAEWDRVLAKGRAGIPVRPIRVEDVGRQFDLTRHAALDYCFVATCAGIFHARQGWWAVPDDLLPRGGYCESMLTDKDESVLAVIERNTAAGKPTRVTDVLNAGDKLGGLGDVAPCTISGRVMRLRCMGLVMPYRSILHVGWHTGLFDIGTD